MLLNFIGANHRDGGRGVSGGLEVLGGGVHLDVAEIFEAGLRKIGRGNLGGGACQATARIKASFEGMGTKCIIFDLTKGRRGRGLRR